MNNKKIKVIIDTDPGVDDSACLIYALFDENIDIKLITSVTGNVKIETGTRNVLHILDLFGKDYPVAKGSDHAMYRISPTAEHIHQKEGMGGYNPPRIVNHNLLDEDAADAMYRVLNEGDGDIIPILLGPHTNMGTLLVRHPEIVKKIPRIIFMGGAPFGMDGKPNYISFNASSDPEALKLTLDTKLPLAMVPSNIGRNKAYLTEEYVYKMKDANETGRLFFEMYSKYWEPGYPDKRIATNDSCALFYLIYPELFKTEKVDISVDVKDYPGKTIATPNPDGQVDLVIDVDREKFLKLLDEKLEKFNEIKLNKN